MLHFIHSIPMLCLLYYFTCKLSYFIIVKKIKKIDYLYGEILALFFLSDLIQLYLLLWFLMGVFSCSHCELYCFFFFLLTWVPLSISRKESLVMKINCPLFFKIIFTFLVSGELKRKTQNKLFILGMQLRFMLLNKT